MAGQATRFKPGQSGNPGGRPKGIAAKAREHADQAIDVLVNGMDDPDPRVRIAAAREILDRGWGKPIAMVAEAAGSLLTSMTDEELEEIIRDGRAVKEALDEADGSDGTKH